MQFSLTITLLYASKTLIIFDSQIWFSQKDNEGENRKGISSFYFGTYYHKIDVSCQQWLQ